MKYLKLYENFNNNIEDLLEDLKWIMIEMTETHKLFGHEKDYCMLYEVSNIPSEDDIESAMGRLEDIGYSIVYIGKQEIAPRDLKGKILCWVVKSELCKEWSPLPAVSNGKMIPLEDNSIIEDIQKNILLKMWKEEPVLDNTFTHGMNPYIQLQTLSIFNYQQFQKVGTWFREYLGPKSSQIMDSIFRSKEQDYKHHITKGGYDFDIEVLSYEIDKRPNTNDIDIKCKILPGGEVSIIMDDGRTLSLKDAVKDKEIGWEIKEEITETIEEYFYKDLQIRNKTGYSITVEYTF
jgi:hypothetical protein